MNSTPPRRRRVAAYLRVSRIGGRSGDGYISLPLQRERVESFAEVLDVEVPEDGWFSDEDYTGGNADRPAFQEAIRRIEAKELDGLIVLRIDRFSRNVQDGAQQLERITKAGGMFASATEHIDVRDPLGEYMFIQMLNNAQLQLRMLKDGWTAAKRKAIARGVHIGVTPFGYVRAPKNIAEGASKLHPHPYAGPAMTELFERAATGAYTWLELARWLTERAPRPTGHPWTASEVKRMLARPVYLGEAHYKSRVAGVEDLVNRDAHEPLTDRRTFDMVQALTAEGRAPLAPANRFLLSGILKCAHCRRAMAGQMNRRPNGQVYGIYRCMGRAENCPGTPAIGNEHVDAYVWELAEATIRRAELELSLEPATDDLDRLEAAFDDAEAELTRYMQDTSMRDLVGDEPWRAGAQERASVRDAARVALDSHLRTNPARRAARKPFEEWTREDLRDWLRGATHAIFVWKGNKGIRRSQVAERVFVNWADQPRIIFHCRGAKLGILLPLDRDDPHADPRLAGFNGAGQAA